ncbi:MAG: DnaJ domain-containing protein [Brevinematales bacterium]|nr:DnaJ domain-containing protein [Brevinematales bacterium]
MKKEQTFYDILHIDYAADKGRIKESFRRLSLKYHPDINRDSESEYIVILEAYKTLIDDKKREEYDKAIGTLINNKPESGYRIPPNRVEYCLSMKSMLQAGMKTDKRIFFSDMAKQIEQDIIFHITKSEIHSGAVGIIDIPSRSVCPVCVGQNPSCYRCEGLGFIKTVEKFRFEVPRDAKNNDIYEVDFNSFRSKMNYWNLKMKRIRIQINTI